MNSQPKNWRPLGAHTYLQSSDGGNCVVVAGTDGLLVIGPGEPTDLDAFTARTVTYTHHVDVAGTSVAHDSEDADVTFSSVWATDLGDCYVEVVHPGRGATSGGLVFTVHSDGVVVVGDLVTQGAPPAYGDDSWPLEWPDTLDLVLAMTPGGSVVVPGRGEPVDRAFVEDQRQQIVDIAERVNIIAGSGVNVDAAYAQGEWPFPEPVMRIALARAYAQWTP